MRKLNHAYMLLWRAVAGKLHHASSEKFSNAQVLVDVGVAPVESVMCAHRFRFAARFFSQAPSVAVHIALLAATNPMSWTAALMADIVDSHNKYEFMRFLPAPTDQWDTQLAWIHDIHSRPRFWKNLAKQVEKAAARCIVAKDHLPTTVSDDDAKFVCYECGSAYDNFNKLASHMSNKHGV